MFRESHPYTIRPRKGVKWEAYKDLGASRPILPWRVARTLSYAEGAPSSVFEGWVLRLDSL